MFILRPNCILKQCLVDTVYLTFVSSEVGLADCFSCLHCLFVRALFLCSGISWVAVFFVDHFKCFVVCAAGRKCAQQVANLG